jgi:hypothetical protein
MFALGERLMAFIRSPRGATELRASARGARDSHFFIYTGPVNGRSLSADTLVGSQEFTTDRGG